MNEEDVVDVVVLLVLLVLDVLVVGSRYVGFGVGLRDVGLIKQFPLWQHDPQYASPVPQYPHWLQHIPFAQSLSRPHMPVYDAQLVLGVLVVVVLEDVVLAKVEVVVVGLETEVELLVLDVLVVEGSGFVGFGVGRFDVGLPIQFPL